MQFFLSRPKIHENTQKHIERGRELYVNIAGEMETGREMEMWKEMERGGR
jgi:hypothetical protein